MEQKENRLLKAFYKENNIKQFDINSQHYGKYLYNNMNF